MRARLLAAMVALLAAVCVAIGVVTVVAARPFLMQQLDDQLQAASARAGGPPGGGGPSGHGQAGCSLRGLSAGIGNEPGTLGACIEGNQVTEAQRLVQADGSVTAVPLRADQYEALASLPADRKPHTVSLGDLGSYRLIATPLPNGEARVTGLPLSNVDETMWWLIAVEAAVAAAGLVAAGLASAVIVRVALRPLRRMVATAGRVSDLPLERGDVALSVRVPAVDTDHRTEVGQVGAAINRMLGHVDAALAARHASETRVRQFVADASHELRTPLAAIRGYAELSRRSGEPVPPDVAHALNRVESETSRMTTLVEDLLLLARLDSGRPLATEPVDLSRLAVDAASDAHAVSPRHRWDLELPAGSVTVTGDQARLHQVLANLLGNARTHTPPGTVVTTSLAVAESASLRADLPAQAGWAVIRVSDNGPGIPADLLPEVFERFARGDTSRSRAAGSTGLGLAIVVAVVEAHGGRVDAESRPGETTITVRLPLGAPAKAVETSVVLSRVP